MHCSPLRMATLTLVAMDRAMAWQSDVSRLVSWPTSVVSKKDVSRRSSTENSLPLHR